MPCVALPLPLPRAALRHAVLRPTSPMALPMPRSTARSFSLLCLRCPPPEPIPASRGFPRASPQPFGRPRSRFGAAPAPVRHPSRAFSGLPEPSQAVSSRLEGPLWTRPSRWSGVAVFEYSPREASSPQIWGDFPLHTLGIQKLSILLPQGWRPMIHQPRSAAWGFVANSDPQPVEKIFMHMPVIALSTRSPQLRARCPQQIRASPHLCPLFGNETPLLTAPSERRHTRSHDWPVGNPGKAGDGSGEN